MSLRNWIEGSASIFREETAFLDKHLDLVSTSKMEDNAITKFQAQVEVLAARSYRFLGLVSFSFKGVQLLSMQI